MADKNTKPEKMKNPYDEYGAHPDETHLGHHWFAWGAVIVFVLLATVPPVWRNAYEIFRGDEGSVPMVRLFDFDSEKGESLFGHLRGVESEFEDAAFTEPPRRALQGVLTSSLREGNRKTLIGKGGWLFFKPAIDGLTGYGPLKPEPDTVAKDPTREEWSGPLEAIQRFGDQLEEMGVELVLVPIPVKPMIYPEMISGGDDLEIAVTHRDAAEFYEQLRESGVKVLDLSENWMALKQRGAQVFLKQDTHWTPAAMQASAHWVARYLRQEMEVLVMLGDGKFADGESRDVASEGDLVEKLDLPEGSRAFADEVAKNVTTVVDAAGNPVSIYDTTSPVVLLGDSFTNIFSDEKMNWGADSGFAQHLAKELGLTVDTIAQNGQASTGVRKSLASRPKAVAQMKKKKVVVWAIAARDLFLSESPAREAQVEWKDVEFSDKVAEPADETITRQVNADSDTDGALKVRARLVTKSAFANPQDVPYPDALYACEYEVEEVLQGSLDAKTLWVFHWAFRNRKLVPSSRHEEGDVREMVLVPFGEQTKLQSVNQANDGFEVPEWWEVEDVAEPAPADAEEEAAAGSPALRAGVVATVYGLLLSGLLVMVARRYGHRLTP
jgi:lysophospholipase L1-like esterase